MSVRIIPASANDPYAGGWVVYCDGCGNGLAYLLDDAHEVDTEMFGSCESASRSAANRGWSLEPPDGRDGAYCPDCVASDADEVALNARVFQAGQEARRAGKHLRDNPHRVRELGALWAKGWCDTDMVFLHEGKGSP